MDRLTSYEQGAAAEEATGGKVFRDAEVCVARLSGCFEESGCQQMPWE